MDRHNQPIYVTGWKLFIAGIVLDLASGLIRSIKPLAIICALLGVSFIVAAIGVWIMKAINRH